MKQIRFRYAMIAGDVGHNCLITGAAKIAVKNVTGAGGYVEAVVTLSGLINR